MTEGEDVLAATLGHGPGHRELEVAADQDAGHRAARHQLGGQVGARARGRDRSERALEHAARRVAEARRGPLQSGRGAGDELGGEAAEAFVEEARRQHSGDELLDGRHHAGRDALARRQGRELGEVAHRPDRGHAGDRVAGERHEKETAPAS